jgi:uncharacterized membrane protein YhaH (DUF805 family)
MDQTMYGTTSASASDAAAAAMMIPMMMFYIAIFVLAVAGMWRVFSKAGRPGWYALVPIYNSIVLAEIVGRPGWVGLLNLVPLLNIYINVIIALDIAKSFGKDTTFGVLTIFFPFVTYPILGFGSAKYQGPSAAGKTLET